MDKKMLPIEGVNSKKSGIISDDKNFNISENRKDTDGETPLREKLEDDDIIGQWALIKTIKLNKQFNAAGQLEDCEPYEREMVVFIGSFDEVAKRFYKAEIAAEAGKLVIGQAAKALAALTTVSAGAAAKV